MRAEQSRNRTRRIKNEVTEEVSGRFTRKTEKEKHPGEVARRYPGSCKVKGLDDIPVHELGHLQSHGVGASSRSGPNTW